MEVAGSIEATRLIAVEDNTRYAGTVKAVELHPTGLRCRNMNRKPRHETWGGIRKDDAPLASGRIIEAQCSFSVVEHQSKDRSNRAGS